MRSNINKVIFSAITIFFAVTIVFIHSSNDASAQDLKKRELSGSELWSQNCARCHNYRGINELSDSQWEISVTHMRVVGNIPGDQARAILKFLQEGNNPPLEPENGALRPTKAKEAVAKGGISQGDAARGKDIYSANCVSCHGSTGKGDGPAAAGISPKPRDLTDAQYVGKLSDEHIYKAISEGGASVGKSPMMPAWGTVLNKNEIADVIAYIRSLSAK